VDGHGGWLYRRAMNQPSSNSDARVCRPERRQSEWQDYCLDETLPQDDVARTVLAYVSLLDLSVLDESIEISDHQAGPPAIAPKS
jgi:hypothetical protein